MISLSEMARHLGGQLVGSDHEFDAISTDSRSIKNGQLFIALVGERFDAHEYLNQVKAQGACAAVVSRLVESELPQILVSDTLVGLGKIGAYMASKNQARCIALTGSCGKTTTKEMIRQALSELGKVYATRGNLNNHIGVPLTLSEISTDDDFAVVEMGASGVGEIEYTVSMTKPEVVLITNASDAHLEGFGSLDNIVQAKGEIVRFAPESATVVLNRDDPSFDVWQTMAGDRSLLSFSLHAESQADVRLQSKELLDDQGYRLTVLVRDQVLDFELGVSGEHMIQNALATLAVVEALSLDLTKAAQGLSQFQAVKGRFSPITGKKFTVWDDTYNANPYSVKAALKTIAGYNKPAWLVLGSMAELGEHASVAHQEVGAFAQSCGFERVFAIGEHADFVVNDQGFSGTAYNKTDMDVLLSDVIRALDASPNQDIQILVKGSRSAGMERVVQALIEWDSKE